MPVRLKLEIVIPSPRTVAEGTGERGEPVTAHGSNGTNVSNRTNDSGGTNGSSGTNGSNARS